MRKNDRLARLSRMNKRKHKIMQRRADCQKRNVSKYIRSEYPSNFKVNQAKN